MKSTAKSIAQSRVLAERIGQRVAGSATIDTVRSAIDANGYPIIFLSDAGVETANAAVIAIRISSEDAVSKDVFGNSLTAFSPHTIEVAWELTAGGAQTPSQLDVMKVMAELGKIGMKIQVKQIALNTAVSEASMNAAAVALSLESEVNWPSHAM